MPQNRLYQLRGDQCDLRPGAAEGLYRRNRQRRCRRGRHRDHRKQQRQAKQQGSKTFAIPFDRQALADYLEVDRSGLSSEISKRRKEGILESEKNRFTLL